MNSFQDRFLTSQQTGMLLSMSRITSTSHCFSHGITYVSHEHGKQFLIVLRSWCQLGCKIFWYRNGIQHRKNSWQDGVSGTNCPIPAGWNWTYQFQVKDQIGSFFYFPSLNFQRAVGGYGGITINNRDVIPLPFLLPDGDVTLFISDWYTKSHKVSLFLILILINKLHSYHINGTLT